MWIKSLNVASSYSHPESARVTLEFTRQDVRFLTNALYHYIKGGQNQNREVCHLYSDLLIAEQLMEAGVLDNWTIERVQDYRSGQYIPSDEDEEDVSD